MNLHLLVASSNETGNVGDVCDVRLGSEGARRAGCCVLLAAPQSIDGGSGFIEEIEIDAAAPIGTGANGVSVHIG